MEGDSCAALSLGRKTMAVQPWFSNFVYHTVHTYLGVYSTICQFLLVVAKMDLWTVLYVVHGKGPLTPSLPEESRQNVT